MTSPQPGDPGMCDYGHRPYDADIGGVRRVLRADPAYQHHPEPAPAAPPRKGCRLLTLALLIPTLCLFPILLPFAGMVAVLGGSWRWTTTEGDDTP